MAKIPVLIVLLAVSPAFAALTCTTNVNPQGILGGDASGYLTGCLQEPTGLKDNPSTPAWNGAYIAWQITPYPTHFHYEYTWSTTEKELSHLILGLSSNCKTDPDCITNFSAGASYQIDTWGDEGGSNPNIPAPLWGMKVTPAGNATSLTFSFDSNRVPVWQNFYAKDGSDDQAPVYAYNTGFGQTGTSYYVAAPDTVIPEPGFYGVLALGLAGLYMAARRRSIAR